MPIHGGQDIQPVSDSAFAEIDRQVMRCAYAAHNSLGRLCEEQVYENDVAARLRSIGLPEISTQVPVTVAFAGFSKTYRLDLVADGMIYELKAVDKLIPEHQAQAFHYAALTDSSRIKLINFGSASVQGKLLRTPFADLNRRAISVDRSAWSPLSENCVRIAESVEACLLDWGGFLSPQLLTEMLVTLFGGDEKCTRRIPIVRNGLSLGHHQVNLHAEQVAFVITTLGGGIRSYHNQLQRLLELLPLRGWQSINVRHSELRLTTITS